MSTREIPARIYPPAPEHEPTEQKIKEKRDSNRLSDVEENPSWKQSGPKGAWRYVPTRPRTYPVELMEDVLDSEALEQIQTLEKNVQEQGLLYF